MKKQQQIEAILELLQEEGLSIEQIEENLNFSIERRTLQPAFSNGNRTM